MVTVIFAVPLSRSLDFKLPDHRADDQATVDDSPDAVRSNQL